MEFGVREKEIEERVIFVYSLGQPQCYSKLVHKPLKVVYIHCELVLKAVYEDVRGKVVLVLLPTHKPKILFLSLSFLLTNLVCVYLAWAAGPIYNNYYLTQYCWCPISLWSAGIRVHLKDWLGHKHCPRLYG